MAEKLKYRKRSSGWGMVVCVMSIGFVWVSISGCSLLVDFPAEDDCGNGVIDEGEQCDDGNHDNSDFCPDGKGGTCQYGGCGDGFLWEREEECDDGNLVDGDGCSSRCLRESEGVCGDGVLDEGEECDDGNQTNHDACPDGEDGTCRPATCGDGFIYVDGGEECDDGDGDNTDVCPDGEGGTCRVATCGDGFVHDGEEECDDGANGDPCDGCLDACTSHTNSCGDGLLCGSEACDDGNGLDGDGCSSNCRWLDCGKAPTLEPCPGVVGSEDLYGILGKGLSVDATELFIVGENVGCRGDYIGGSWSWTCDAPNVNGTMRDVLTRNMATLETVSVGFDNSGPKAWQFDDANDVWVSLDWSFALSETTDIAMAIAQGQGEDGLWVAAGDTLYRCGTGGCSTFEQAGSVRRDVHGVAGTTNLWSVGNRNDGSGTIWESIWEHDSISWVEVDSWADLELHGIWVASASSAWVVGEENNSCASIKGEPDSGNWSIEPCPDGVGGLNAVWIDADSVAWAVGQAGKILRNEGSGWLVSSSPTTQPLHGIWGWGSGADKEIWTVGASGTVLRYKP
jgi:cysteine-rich repeat protein